MTRNDVSIAVVGGGIGGLTLGLALRQHGLPAQVFERAPELTEVGAAVALAANGTRILRELGLSDQLATVSTVPTELIYRHWSDGRRLVAHPVGDWYRDRFGAPFWGIHRADLQRTLAAAWGSSGLHLGKELTEMRELADGIALSFADGSAVRADLVVGADGINSQVRRWICETAPVYSRTSGFRGLVPRTALPHLPDPGAVQFWMGPGAHLLHYAIGDVINFLAVVEGPAEWQGPGSTAPAEPGELAEHFAGWNPAVTEMICAVPQSPRWALYSLPPLSRWSRGRAVLLGDAAHAMLPHHGQGANQTLEDAAVLADCLAEYGPDDSAAAFARYERARRARTRQVQRSSLVTSALLHLPDGPAAAARDSDLSQLVNRFSWIHQYDRRSQAHPGRRLSPHLHLEVHTMTVSPARYELAHMAYAELFTPDMEGSLWFFTQLLGMRETGRQQDSVYLRCYEDPYHHSLKLTASDKPGLGNVAWRTTSSEALERRAAALDEAGIGKGWTKGDLGVGRTFAFESPDGHPMELVWDVEKYAAPPELRSRILTRRSRRPLRGLPPRRLDHINLMASDVTTQKELFETTLGFGTRERVIDAAHGGTEIGAWMSVNILGHEMAIMRDQTGAKGRLHHLAFWYGVPQHNTDAAELCREYGIQIEAGPDVHGITQGAFLYVFEPGGNRIELFGNSGILQFEPDYETVTWDLADFDTGLAIGGATLPVETYFIYGTPAAAGQDKLLTGWQDRALV